MATGIFENMVVFYYVMEVLGLIIGEQSRLMVVWLSSPTFDPVSIVACALKYIERKPITMQMMVNDSKLCVDDHDGIVFVLAHLDRLPFQLHKWRISS